MILNVEFTKYCCIQSCTLHYTCFSIEDFCGVKSLYIYWNTKVLLSIFYRIVTFKKVKTCWKPVMVKQRTKTFTHAEKGKPPSANVFINLSISCACCSRKKFYRKIFLQASLRGVLISEVLPTASCCIFSARFSE